MRRKKEKEAEVVKKPETRKRKEMNSRREED